MYVGVVRYFPDCCYPSIDRPVLPPKKGREEPARESKATKIGPARKRILSVHRDGSICRLHRLRHGLILALQMSKWNPMTTA